MDNIAILNDIRLKVGSAQATHFRSSVELNKHSRLPRFKGGLEFYEGQFPYGDYWPIFELSDIWIDRQFRCKGFGTRAISEITDHYQEMGARIGFLVVATQGEPLTKGFAWRTKWYSDLGWVLLKPHPEERAVYPLMYLPLKGRPLTSTAESRLFEFVPDAVPCPLIEPD